MAKCTGVPGLCPRSTSLWSPSDIKNYRPISNFSFVLKVVETVERIVVRQLLEYFTANSLLPKFQSGFRMHDSTESALLWVLSDIFSATDKGEVSLLALFDVSAAFDTVDHSILLNRLSISYGISGSAFDWMQSFIVGRTQTVHYGGSVSRRAQLRSGIAQGSALGPILYVLYTADVHKLVQSFGFRVHFYADDTQFHDSCKSTDAAVLAARAMSIIEAVKEWMSSNQLRLNADKTQFIWLGTSHFLDVLQINHIPANEVVNNLGVYFDPELLMERQVNKLCQVSYFHLRRLRTVCRSLTKESMLTLVNAFITSRVDHCNGGPSESNGYVLGRLQSVLNSAARLILGFLSSTAFLPPSAMNFTGCRSKIFARVIFNIK